MIIVSVACTKLGRCNDFVFLVRATDENSICIAFYLFLSSTFFAKGLPLTAIS